MSKRILSTLIIAFFVSSASVFAGNENVLIIHDVEAEAGSIITIALEIQNDDEVIGFNCDISLPDGFSLIEGSGEYFRTVDHQLSLSLKNDNVARLMLFSMTNTFLEGNEGVVTTFDVQTPDTPGTYLLEITGIPVIGTIINGNATNVITGTGNGEVALASDEFTLAIQVVGEGNVNVDGAPYTEPVIIEQGSLVTLNAVADDNWHFNEWTGDHAGNLDDATAADAILTMPADHVDLTATFAMTEFVVSFMVMDEGENPLQGAIITINGEELLTSADGEADFQLSAGSYDYTVELECLLTEESAINVSDDLEVAVIMERLPGDVNGDGLVNLLDIITIANYYASGHVDPFCFENADMNNDGIINVLDLLLVVNMFADDDKMVMHQDLNSEDTNLYLNPDAISLSSNGTLAGIQVEWKGNNPAFLTPNLNLIAHQILYRYDKDLLRDIQK